MKKVLLLFIIGLALSLRIFQLGQTPASLYWDEVSLGYNAYSIATSLHDEHGEYVPLARFIAFGDYKPPGYIYAAVPSILTFGLNEFAVRFPSMLAGLLMVLITYYFTKELFANDSIALLSSLVIAISPWAIQFSRAAFEANLAAFFNLFGVYLFLVSRRKKWIIILSVISFILSFYTFNANRIIAPLLLLSLSIIYGKSIINNKKWVLISIIISLIALMPSYSYLQSHESKLRFQEVSIFNNLSPVEISNERIKTDGNTWWAKIIHNRRILFAEDYLKHYFDNFSGRFLFTHGDINPRLAVQSMGEFYPWDLPFLLIGIYWLVKKREKNLAVLSIWMMIAAIPAATARETPHALRILSILPTYHILIAYGLFHVIKWMKLKIHKQNILIAFSVICFLLSVNIFYYLHDYYIHYSRDWSGEWQYGYKQMVSYVSSVADKYDHIFVTNALGRPYIYFAFFDKYSSADFSKNRVAERDWFGFWDVKSLGKIQFDFSTLPKSTGRILIVNTPGNLPGDFHLLQKVKNLKDEDVFWIAERI
ncbi:phospholipid carrier-dependent glycosyltransferase [Candidatus Gottesmanbacteria bacterium]|nr:phospholipid carrier-dependent glycosyltransferase [Candidatus Gottesmanbacteria bacterium]